MWSSLRVLKIAEMLSHRSQALTRVCVSINFFLISPSSSLTSLVKSIKKSINFLSKENESFLCFNLFIFALVSHSVHWQWNNFVTWESERDFGSWGWMIQFSILRYIHTFAHTQDTNERKSRSSNYIDFGVQCGVWKEDRKKWKTA